MYHSNNNYSRAFYCSTGRAGHRTPTTEGNRSFTISYPYGKKYNENADYVKWDSSYVRYPTQFRSGYFFHSIPYHLTSNGRLDKAKLKTTDAYRQLGKSPLSLGCVRMSLRDAKFLHHNSRSGMPVYIYNSSKGHSIPTPAWLPPVKYATWDPTDTDPRSPYMKNVATYKVSYDANGATGGQVPVDTNSYTSGAEATLKGPGSLAREGHEFVGWSLKQIPGEGEQLRAPGSRLQITQNVTLYAQWKPAATTTPSTTPAETTQFSTSPSNETTSPASTSSDATTTMPTPTPSPTTTPSETTIAESTTDPDSPPGGSD